MGGSNLPQQQQVPANLTEEQNAQRIQNQGMSDQGIVSFGEGVNAAKGLYKDVKRTMIDPAVTAVKDTFTAPQNQMLTKTTEYRDLTPDEMLTEKMYPMRTETIEESFDPILGTKIKGMMSSTGIQQNTSIDKVRYDRNATGSEFKGVKAKAKPAKSVINMTADEAMQDL